MGMFDRVSARCPNCNEIIEWQSKAGDCNLDDYSIESVPVEIAADIDGEYTSCDNCTHSVRIKSIFPITRLPMYVE